MKRLTQIIIVAITTLSVVGLCLGQQFTPVTTTATTVPPVVWWGTNALIIANQLLAVTNMDGSLVVPPGLLTNRTSNILIRVECGTNGLRSIRATIR